MPFIKVQKRIVNADGNIVGGSASIVDVKYTGTEGKYHSKQVVREVLGAVLWMPSKRKGIFLSPKRGLVEYDADADSFTAVPATDPRVADTKVGPTPAAAHVVFGDAFMLLKFLDRCGLLALLRSVFTERTRYERALIHLLYGILKDGSRISCKDFTGKSLISYLTDSIPLCSLQSDTAYFSFMGQDETKMRFFREYVKAMRATHPDFGIGCYIDSTPLPNDSANNPFNALCSHGLKGCDIQMRLVLIVDEKTGAPVWYDIIPGNVPDISTVKKTCEKVQADLDISIGSLVVDAGYVTKDMVEMCHAGTKRQMIGRMPARKGYPYRELYEQAQEFIKEHKHDFRTREHDFFGMRCEITLFGYKTYAYVYVDRQNALRHYGEFQDKHPDECEQLSDQEREWYAVKFGYFVLLANRYGAPKEIYDDYFARTEIESVFKTAKSYLGLLPLCKWTDQTVRGKILSDIIGTIALLELRKSLNPSGITVSSLVGKSQSLMCTRGRDDTIIVDTPNKDVKAIYQALDLTPPGSLSLEVFRKRVIEGL